jgi:Ser/Thr protein kinase RdoA (MazF antagonist)
MNAAVGAAEFLARMQAIARAALERWDLPVAGIVPIKVRENAVFKIDLAGGGRAVLRVHREGYHSDPELESEFAWLRALEAGGIEVPRVIASRQGRTFETVTAPGAEGTHQIDIFEWIDGRQLGSIETGVGTDEAAVADQYQRIGVLAARMHDHSLTWPPPQGFCRHAWDAPGLVGEQPLWGRFWELEALTRGEGALLRRARAAIGEDLEAYGIGRDRYGLIHADLVPENVLVDGERVCVIDFDDAGYGWHLFELATSLYFLTGESVYPVARDALIRGYRLRRALSEEALARLPLFLAARGTTYVGWVHTRAGTQTARELTPFLIERACAVAAEYLAER